MAAAHCRQLHFLFLEPYYGGSHRQFADGLVGHSRHRIDLHTLPDRFWKWRMRGAALQLYHRLPDLSAYDGIIATDLMSIADFKALVGAKCPPILVYFHENQLTYPLAPGESPDYQFGFTNITTALAADRLLFNSDTHRQAFLAALPAFLAMMPDCRPRWITEAIRRKSAVAYPGCPFGNDPPTWLSSDPSAPLVIWNHRWEFDKDPDAFFEALRQVSQRGIAFRLALLGENFQVQPKAFIAARKQFAEQLVQYGFVVSRKEYLNWLAQGCVVVSTANQENFGMAVIEAIRYGCVPLLPRRLSYPEILPQEFHEECLYDTHAQLVDRLCLLLTHPDRTLRLRVPLSAAMATYGWQNRAAEFDRHLEKLVNGDSS